MRSAPELARLFAIALPLSVNSRVRLSCSDRYATGQRTAARGTSTRTRNTVILPRRPKRTRGAGLVPTTCSPPGRPPFAPFLIARLRQTRFAAFIPPSDLHRRRPVHDRHPAVAVHPREVHAVQALVTLGREREGRADPQVEPAQRLERLAEARAPRVGARALQRLSDDPRIDVALEADEAVLLQRVVDIANRLRHRRIILIHQNPVLDHPEQDNIVIAQHHLKINKRTNVIATLDATMLHEQGEHS